MMRPFVRLPSGNGKPPVFNADPDALSRWEAGVFDPPPGEFHPRIKRRWFAIEARCAPVALKASRLLDGHEAFRDG
jgi:hypothetical protein